MYSLIYWRCRVWHGAWVSPSPRWGGVHGVGWGAWVEWVCEQATSTNNEHAQHTWATRRATSTSKQRARSNNEHEQRARATRNTHEATTITSNEHGQHTRATRTHEQRARATTSTSNEHEQHTRATHTSNEHEQHTRSTHTTRVSVQDAKGLLPCDKSNLTRFCLRTPCFIGKHCLSFPLVILQAWEKGGRRQTRRQGAIHVRSMQL